MINPGAVAAIRVVSVRGDPCGALHINWLNCRNLPHTLISSAENVQYFSRNSLRFVIIRVTFSTCTKRRIKPPVKRRNAECI